METQEVVVNYDKIPACLFCLEGSDIEEVVTITCPSGKDCVMHVHETCLEDWYDTYSEPSCPLCRKEATSTESDIESEVIEILPRRDTQRRVRCSRDRAVYFITLGIRSMCFAGGALAFLYIFIWKT